MLGREPSFENVLCFGYEILIYVSRFTMQKLEVQAENVKTYVSETASLAATTSRKKEEPCANLVRAF